MNINVYLPDDLGKRAKEADLAFSGLLREAVEDELERRAAMSKTLTNLEEHRVDLEDSDGRPYVGRITGKFLGEGHGAQAFLTEDGRLLVYEEDKLRYSEVDDPSEIEGWFPHDPDVVLEVMYAVGQTPEVDL